MEGYLLTRFENGHEVEVCYGSTLEGVKSVIESSEGFFKDGYSIYKVTLIESNKQK